MKNCMKESDQEISEENFKEAENTEADVIKNSNVEPTKNILIRCDAMEEKHINNNEKKLDGGQYQINDQICQEKQQNEYESDKVATVSESDVEKERQEYIEQMRECAKNLSENLADEGLESEREEKVSPRRKGTAGSQIPYINRELMRTWMKSDILPIHKPEMVHRRTQCPEGIEHSNFEDKSMQRPNTPLHARVHPERQQNMKMPINGARNSLIMNEKNETGPDIKQYDQSRTTYGNQYNPNIYTSRDAMLLSRHRSNRFLEASLGLLKLKRIYRDKTYNEQGYKYKTVFQTHVLNEILKYMPYPNTQMRDTLAILLNLNPRTIQIWFQNARQGSDMQLPKEEIRRNKAGTSMDINVIFEIFEKSCNRF